MYPPVMDESYTEQWLTVADAAERLGVSNQAIRQRIYRNTIEHTKGADGTVYVRVTDTEEQVNITDKGETNALALDYITALKERIQHLEEESRRKDHLLAQALSRIPELEAPSEAPRSPQERQEEASEGTDTPEQQEPISQRSWWRRFFGA